MSSKKKSVREAFRKAVFARDGNKCKVCRVDGNNHKLDAHHITDRTLMPNGGYVLENGISLCELCHEKAEQFHQEGQAITGWWPDDLYRLIDSSRSEAYAASRKLDKT